MPLPVPRSAIREEGTRLGYRGDELEEFVFLVAHIDDEAVRLDRQQIGRDIKRQADAMKNRRP